MHIKPNENTKLLYMNEYFNEISSLYDERKMPNKILLSGKRGLGKSTLAYHIINYILSEEEQYQYDKKNLVINSSNRSFKLILNKCHPNFYLIDLINEKKNIDITQIRDMITYTNKSSFNGLPKFILIDNIENLNRNSINALLKIVEEPNENIFFILIHNSEKKILPTLKSRCITFKINFSYEKTVKILSLLLERNIFDLINYELISHYNTTGDIINLINFADEKKIDLKKYSVTDLLILFIDNSYYKKNKPAKELIINFIELYFLNEYKLSNTKNFILGIYHDFIEKIYNTEKFNLDEESIFLEFKAKLING